MVAFCIYAHAAARNPILEHRGKKERRANKVPEGWGEGGGRRTLLALKVPVELNTFVPGPATIAVVIRLQGPPANC